VNCAAIPKDLIESELFGFEKGAFTGATQRRIGLFEQANGGTLLLDEIGEMPMQLQAKLLRVLQENEVTRIGGTEKKRIDVRIIAATNKNLLEEIQKGAFRSDLYYRLNVFPIELPPLRFRENDIIMLADYFLSKFNAQYGSKKEFSPQAVQALKQYRWPGNARELKNFIERLIILAPQNIITSAIVLNLMNEHLDDKIISGPSDENEIPLKDAVDNFEREVIRRALQKHKSTYKAAKALKTSQPTIVRKAKALNITGWN
jgi:transcriptional regulator with PAS, ATPase and Fis domain